MVPDFDDWLNQRRASVEQEKQEVETQKADAETKIRELEAELERLKTKPPSGVCFICFYETGSISKIRAIPADPATPGVDRFACENGHEF